MSQTATIKTVPIRDPLAIRAAILALQARGVKCSLVENQKPRVWPGYPVQKCDFVIQLQDCRFDVGLAKNEHGIYEPKCDLHGREIQKVLGARGKTAHTGQAAHIGQFIQEYSKAAAINAATEAGYMIERLEEDNEGNIHIHVLTN